MEVLHEEIVSALRRAKIARHLTEAERAQLAAAVGCRRWPSGTEVSRPCGLLLVVRGYVDILASSGGGRVAERRRGSGGTPRCRESALWSAGPDCTSSHGGGALGPRSCGPYYPRAARARPRLFALAPDRDPERIPLRRSDRVSAAQCTLAHHRRSQHGRLAARSWGISPIVATGTDARRQLG